MVRSVSRAAAPGSAAGLVSRASGAVTAAAITLRASSCGGSRRKPETKGRANGAPKYTAAVPITATER